MPALHCPRCGELLSLSVDLNVWSCPVCGEKVREGVKVLAVPAPTPPTAALPAAPAPAPPPVPVKTAPPPSTAPQAPQPQPPVRPRRREPWYWSLCLVIVILVNIRCLTVLHRAESAVQEAAIAATAAWWTVAAYVVTRCVEGLHWRNPPQ